MYLEAPLFCIKDLSHNKHGYRQVAFAGSPPAPNLLPNLFFKCFVCSDLALQGRGAQNPETKEIRSSQETALHAQYDWTTGVPDNGNEWRKFRAVPRLYP